MNNTDYPALLPTSNVSDIGYGIGVSVGLLLLITTIVLTSYYCSRTDNRTSPSAGIGRTRMTQEFTGTSEVVVEIGLSEDTIESYPKMLFSEANMERKEGIPTSCSICLADYRSSDVLRQLPDCRHFFHLKCVYPWLRLNPSCPLCRTSPYPKPLSTPLAEVVPLASSGDR